MERWCALEGGEDMCASSLAPESSGDAKGAWRGIESSAAELAGHVLLRSVLLRNW